MRKDPTKAELAFWELVQAKRYQGWKFRREHPIGPFIVDFYCHTEELIVEIDGEIHDVAEIQAYDRRRQATLEGMGYRVVRFKNEEILKQGASILPRLHRAS